MVNVAINGFGRIGRIVFRCGFKDKKINFVALNDIADAKTLAYLLKYDSVYGKFPGKVEAKDNFLIVNGKKIKIISEKEPQKLPWKKMKIDIVVESSGLFTDKKSAEKHLKAGAKKVIITAPYSGEDYVKTVVMGVNEKTINKDDKIISNGSCTTNCLTPMVKVLNDNFGIVDGFMTTIHSYTADQRLVDAPHKDLRRGRSAALNMVPTTTGATKSVAEAIPELKGKMNGLAIRVPTPCGSLTDFVAKLKKPVTKEEVNAAFKKESNKIKNVLEYNEDPIVSKDIVGNPHSCIFDSLSTMVINDSVKVIGWYDNEYGYSCRIIDLIKYLKK